MPDVKCQWHKFPKHGCDNPATHFCQSLVPPSKGITPAHRAFCDECFAGRYTQMAIESGQMQEVPLDVWQALHPV